MDQSIEIMQLADSPTSYFLDTANSLFTLVSFCKAVISKYQERLCETSSRACSTASYLSKSAAFGPARSPREAKLKLLTPTAQDFRSHRVNSLTVLAAKEGTDEHAEKQIPVTVLTGFLGAGKTTLLNHILNGDHGKKFAIIENEFGDVGVDEKIIGGNDLNQKTDEEIIEVMNGCICCTVRRDLVDTLKRLAKKIEKFDGVIVETTGLADPAPVAQTFFIDEAIRRLYSLDGIVTVVDAKHVVMRLDDEKPEGVKNEAQEQLAFADRVLLNKVDLVPEEEDLQKIEARIREINANAPIYRCTNSEVDWRQLINVGAFDIQRVLDFEPEFLTDLDAEHEHDQSVTSASVKFEGDLQMNQLGMYIKDLLQEKGADLFRYKGVFAVKGIDNKYVFQGVGMIFTGFYSEIKWGKDEPRECRFVFIGRNLDEKALVEGIRACEIKDELRFKVGDIVEARVEGGWAKGRILKQWDKGNPYRIELQDRTKTNVFGRIDDNKLIRAFKR